LKDRRAALGAAQKRSGGMRLLLGVEADVLEDGKLAGSEAALKGADIVFAAVNSHFDLPRPQQTERLLAAIRNPHVSVLAHPTCRLVNRREPIDADWPRIIGEAAQLGVALELTGDPERLDLTDVHCRMARDLGAQMVLGSDAHIAEELGRIEFALLQARRGWLEARHVLNTAPVETMLKRLRGRSPSGGTRRPAVAI
jgi:DNA polymerase (family 10)